METGVQIADIQDFPAHLLYTIKGRKLQGRFLYFDSETKSKKVEGVKCEFFYMGWTCLKESWSRYFPDISEWRYWKNEQKLNEYIEKTAMSGKPLYLIGHNIFFDIQACGFFHYFTKWKWVLDFVYDKGLTYILKCKKKDSVLTIISTTNYFNCNLAFLGKMVSLKKLDIEFKKAKDSELKVYCKRDVDILIKAISYYKAFLIRNRLGYMGLTKSAQAFIAYRHRFMHHKIMIHSDETVTALERKAYIGGRVECFRIGKIYGGPFVSLDINSMYPYVMANNMYPWKLVEYNRQFDIERYKQILKSFSVVAHIEVDTPESAYAIHYDDKIIFPIGNFECYVCSTGLQYAIDNQHIKRIINIAVYRQADLFSHYVQYFYNLKLKYGNKKNLIMRELCKYMLNSLYGKFGQKGIKRIEFDEISGRNYYKEVVWDSVRHSYVIILKLMNKLIYQYQDNEGENSFPGLAAHITENARFVLWQLIKGLGKHKVLYCDTDSIKIRQSDISHLHWDMDAVRLGALKIEDTSNELYIGGCKNYRTENIRKIKGIPHKAIEIEPGTFEFTMFGRQNIHLRKGQDRGVITTRTTRELKAVYNKGNVSPEGIVTPFRFPLV